MRAPLEKRENISRGPPDHFPPFYSPTALTGRLRDSGLPHPRPIRGEGPGGVGGGGGRAGGIRLLVGCTTSENTHPPILCSHEVRRVCRGEGCSFPMAWASIHNHVRRRGAIPFPAWLLHPSNFSHLVEGAGRQVHGLSRPGQPGDGFLPAPALQLCEAHHLRPAAAWKWR